MNEIIRTRRAAVLLGVAFLAAGTLGGCVYRKETVPVASPGTTTVVVTPGQRTVTYPEGRYVLYGEPGDALLLGLGPSRHQPAGAPAVQ